MSSTLRARRRPEEFRFETDLRSGFGHLPGITNRNARGAGNLSWPRTTLGPVPLRGLFRTRRERL